MPKEVDAIQSRGVKNWPALKGALGRLKKLLPDDMAKGNVEAYIVGGSVVDAISPDPIATTFAPSKDIDVFFPTEEAFERTRDGFNDLETTGEATLVFQQANKTSYVFRNVKFDLVSSVYRETAEELVDLVDFTVSTGAFDLRDDHFCSHRLFFQDVASRALRAHALPNPTKTMFRLPRYCRRGFWPDYGTLTRIGKHIEQAALEREFLTTAPESDFDPIEVTNQDSVETEKLFDFGDTGDIACF